MAKMKNIGPLAVGCGSVVGCWLDPVPAWNPVRPFVDIQPLWLLGKEVTEKSRFFFAKSQNVAAACSDNNI